MPSGIDQEIERDEQCRRLAASRLIAALRRMNTLKESVEGECSALRNNNLAVEHELLGLQCAKGIDQLGKIARQRLAGFRLNFD